MDNINWQHFIVEYSSGWALGTSIDWPPDFNWSWNPDEADDTWDTGTWSMIHGSLYLYNGVWAGSVTGPSAPKPITYTVSDNNDPYHAVASARYLLTLHDSVEWNKDPGYPHNLPPILIGAPEQTVTPGSDLPVMYPPPTGELHYNDSDGSKIFTIVTAVGGALPLSGGFLEIPGGAYVTLLLSGVSAISGSYGPTASQEHKTLSTNESDFANDVTTQADINSGNTSGINFPDKPRFPDPILLALVQSDPSGWYHGRPHQQQTDAGYWKVTAQVIEYRSTVSWTGMAFDAAGFNGWVHSNADYPTTIGEGIRNWTFTPLVP